MTPLVCPGCAVAKPPTAYYANRTRPVGISYLCRECAKAASRRRARESRASGRCACGQPRQYRYTHCLRCILRSRQRGDSQAWRPGGRGRPPGR